LRAPGRDSAAIAELLARHQLDVGDALASASQLAVARLEIVAASRHRDDRPPDRELDVLTRRPVATAPRQARASTTSTRSPPPPPALGPARRRGGPALNACAANQFAAPAAPS